MILKPIKGYKGFSKVYERGKRFHTKNATAVVCFRDSNDSSGIIYYGVTASKKRSKSAVIRNRIKRLLRESLRHSLGLFVYDEFIPFEYIILTWRKAPARAWQLSLGEVMPEVRELLSKSENYFGKHKSTGAN